MKQIYPLLIVGVVLSLSSVKSEKLGDFNLDKMTTMQIILNYGYPCETIKVVTEDGYIIVLFRIPGNKGQSLEEAKRNYNPPVILQHGLICSTDNFVDDAEISFPFILADLGWDVWLPNIRGNRYSRTHTQYTTSDPAFWNFTFEQMGTYDQMAYWKYIMQATGRTKIPYIAHSQGTSQMLAALTLQPQFYKEHLDIFVLWGPVARLVDAGCPLIKVVTQANAVEIFEFFKVYDLFPYQEYAASFLSFVTKKIPSLTKDMIQLMADRVTDHDNHKRYPDLMFNYPSGASTKDFAHILQLYTYAGFNRYRASPKDELVPYNFSNIPGEIPIVMMVGADDQLASPGDSEWLRNQLESRKKKVIFYKEYSEMGHLTFLLPDQILPYYNDTIDFIKPYYKKGTDPVGRNAAFSLHATWTLISLIAIINILL